MSVHVLLDSTFFRTSVGVAAQQRMLTIPANRGLNVGDTIFLRDESGTLTWVMDVLLTGEVAGTDAWSGSTDPAGRYALIGNLARIHPDILPAGKSRLQSPWVTLNSRTLENALPWWETHVLLYHSTLHLIEGLLTLEQVGQGLRIECLIQHPSGHILVPHGEARKRLLVRVIGVPLDCTLCGAPIASLSEATQDHVIPISQGGPDALANIALAHRSCNELKGNALPEQYPPIFPTPEQTKAWRPTFRHGRHRPPQRGRRPQTRHHGNQEQQPQVPLRGTGAGETGQAASAATSPESTAPAAVKHTEQQAATAKQTAPTTPAAAPKAQPKRADQRRATPAAPRAEAKAPQQQRSDDQKPTADEQRAKSEPVKTPSGGTDPQWLEKVQRCTWTDLIELAADRDWAAKTASLRTLEQLPRSDIKDVQANGRLIVEQQGARGSYSLLQWEASIVLVEERNNRHHYFVVKELDAISWETYVWYLTRFGRTTPLAVAMSLLPLWRRGTPDAEGRVQATKTGIDLEMRLQDNRLTITEKDDSIDVA